MPNETINVKCTKCGHQLKVKNPGKPGMYDIACPQCQHHMQLSLKAKPLTMEGTPDNQQPVQEGKKRVPLLTDLTPLKDGTVFAVKPAVAVGKTYALKCPKCGKPVVFALPKSGVQGVKCKKCDTLFYTKGKEVAPEAGDTKKEEPEQKEKNKTTRISNKKKTNSSPGVLSWGNILRRKKVILHEGVYVLGRADDECHSDIEFKDPKMSRRSVRIEVKLKENGFFFKLTVEKATNPVLINNKPLGENECVYLNYGDAIQLGATVINFSKLSK